MPLETQIREIEALLKRQKEEIKALSLKKNELEVEISHLSKEFSDSLDKKRKIESEIASREEDLKTVKSAIEEHFEGERKAIAEANKAFERKILVLSEREKKASAIEQEVSKREGLLALAKERIFLDLEGLSKEIQNRLSVLSDALI